MIPMNNRDPISLLVSLVQNGGNPTALINQMAQQNPQVFQAMQMMRGKTSQQLESMARNMAADRGIDINEMMRQLGVNNASRR